MTYFFVAALVVLFGVAAYTYAAAPQTINYQGKLLDGSGSPVADGAYSMTFRLYDTASGGTHLWTETQSVDVQSGLFSVLLGTSTSLSSIDFNQQLYLGINVASDGEMTPRKALATVPTAFEAENAQTVGGVASTSFLRSDQADSASGLLTLNGGLISSASSTIANLTTVTATTTTFVINGESFTDLTGTALTNSAGVLSVDTSLLDTRYATSTNFDTESELETLLGDVGNVFTNNDTIGVANGGTGATTLTGVLIGNGTSAVTGSSTLSTSYIVDAYVRNTGDSISGNLTFSGSAANIALGSNYLSGDGDDEGVYVDASGNVGIGTSSPSFPLHVYDQGTTTFLTISGDGSNNARLLFNDGIDTVWNLGHIDSTGNFTIYDDNSTATRLVIEQGTGNVAIGNTDPFSIFHVEKDSSTAWSSSFSTPNSYTPLTHELSIINQQVSTNGSYAGIFLQAGEGASNTGLNTARIAAIREADFNTALAFSVRSTANSNAMAEAMRIDSSGNVGIGTTSPNTKLTVEGTGGQGQAQIGTAADYLKLGYDGANAIVNNSGSGNLLINYDTGNITSINGGTNDGLVNLSDALFVTANERVGIGSTTPFTKFTVDGSIMATGALYDNNYSAGTNGYVLQSTGGGFNWVATSSLGIGGGGSITFGTDNQIPFTNSGGGDFDYSTDLTYDGSTFALASSSTLELGGSKFWVDPDQESLILGWDHVSSPDIGIDSIAIGAGALENVTPATGFGNNNIAIGKEAGTNVTTGQTNVFIGSWGAGINTTEGNNNVFIGYTAGYNNTTGYNNTFTGYAAGNSLVSGNNNTFFGSRAGEEIATSSDSVVIGEDAAQGSANYEADKITVIGGEAGNSFTSGAHHNALFGYRAGYGVTSGANNLLLGYQAADNLTTGSNNIVIGYNIDAPSATGGNQLNIGNIIYGTSIDGTGSTISSGNIGIGTTSPAKLLDIYGSGDADLRLTNSNDGTYWELNTRNVGDFDIVRGGTTFVTYENTGDVGIGDTTPDALLEISNSGGATDLLRLSSDDDLDGDIFTVGGDGNIGIGTTSPNNIFEIWGDNVVDAPAALTLYTDNDSGQNDRAIEVIGVDNPSAPTAFSTNFIVKSDGSVGIGTSSPDVPLHVYRSGNNNVGLIESDTTSAYLWLINSTARAAGGFNDVGIGASGRNLLFRTGDATQMTLDSSGNLGIGTTSPAQKLDVRGDIGISDNSPGVWLNELDGTKDAHIVLDAGSILFQRRAQPYGAYEAAPFDVSIDAPDNAFILDSSGNLGIGDTSPSGLLSLLSNNPETRFEDSDTTNNAEITLDDTALRLEADPDNNTANSLLRFHVDNSLKYTINSNGYLSQDGGDEGIYIDSVGRVGIGTTSPSVELHVSKANAQSRFKVESGGVNTDAIFALATATGAGWSIFNDESDAQKLKFYANSGTRLTFDQDGKVGIGDITPNSTLTVNGNIDIADDASITDNTFAATPTFFGVTFAATGQTGPDSVASGNRLQLKAPTSIDVLLDSNNNKTNTSFTIGKNDDTVDGANYSELFRVQENGEIAIGTSDPLSVFHVERSTSTTWSSSFSTPNSYTPLTHELSIINQQVSTNGSYAGIFLQAGEGASNTGLNTARIAAIREADFNTALAFSVRSTANSSAMAEALRIDSSGNVGIGTANPDSLLEVANGDVYISGSNDNPSRVLQFKWKETVIPTIDSTLGGIEFYSADSSNPGVSSAIYGLGSIVNLGELAFHTGVGGSASEVMRIDASGNVGIGTTSPQTLLDIYGAGSADIRVRNSNAANYWELNTRNDNTFDINYGGSQYVKIDDAGRLGIGDTSPSGLLSLLSNNPETRFEDSDTTNNGEITLDNTSLRLEADPDNNTANSLLRFHVDNSEVMRIDSSGNVGIGETSAADTLDVDGDIRVGTGTTGCVKDSDGTVIAGTCSSDSRLKTDINTLRSTSTDKSYLEAMTALEPVNYRWNNTAATRFAYGTEELQTGLIAQQVQASMPELVAEGEDGFLQVRFSEIPIYLLQAMRELWDKVRGNSDDIEALKARVEALEARLEEEEGGNSTSQPTSSDTSNTGGSDNGSTATDDASSSDSGSGDNSDTATSTDDTSTDTTDDSANSNTTDTDTSNTTSDSGGNSDTSDGTASGSITDTVSDDGTDTDVNGTAADDSTSGDSGFADSTDSSNTADYDSTSDSSTDNGGEDTADSSSTSTGSDTGDTSSGSDNSDTSSDSSSGGGSTDSGNSNGSTGSSGSDTGDSTSSSDTASTDTTS